MKKILGIIMLFLMSILPLDAKIKIQKDVVDKVTKERVIETDWYSFSTTGNKNFSDVHLRFRYDDGVEYLEIKHVLGEDVTIRKNHKVLINCENNTFYSKIIDSTSQVGDGSIGYAGSHIKGINVVCGFDYIWLLYNTPKSIHIETTNKRIDLKIEKKVGKDIVKLYKLFLKGSTGQT